MSEPRLPHPHHHFDPKHVVCCTNHLVCLFLSNSRFFQPQRPPPPTKKGKTLESEGSLCLEEALVKCGGSHKQLEEGLKAGRIIRGMAGKLEMFFFPRRQYAREKLVKQGLHSRADKGTDDLASLDIVAENESDWDPSTLLATGLGDVGLSLTATGSSQSMPPPPLMLSGPGASLPCIPNPNVVNRVELKCWSPFFKDMKCSHLRKFAVLIFF